MKKSLVVLIAAIFCFSFGGSLAAEPSMEERLEALEERVKQLESLIEKAGLELPAGEAAEEEAAPNIGDRVAFSGALEVEASAGHTKQVGGGKIRTSDITLATAELGFGVGINEKFSGNLVLLWEEDDTEPIDIDEGVIVYSRAGFDLTAGRFYPPFGTFNTHFIADPMTLELGEIQQSGVQFHYAPSDYFEAYLVVANGEVDRTNRGDNINDFGLRLDFHPLVGEDASLDLGLQYYSDIADTAAAVAGAGAVLRKMVGGLGANVDWARGPWSANFEYVGALRDFDPANLDTDADGDGDSPSAWNLEVGYALSDVHEMALKYEGSREFADFPKSLLGAVSNWDLGDGVGLGLEYLYGTFDRGFSTTGARRSHLLTTQLAIEF